MTAQADDVTLVVEARDNGASRTITNISQRLKNELGGSVRSAALSMVSLTSLLSVVGVSLTGVIVLTKKWFEGLQETNRAVTSITRELRGMGFSVERANARVSELRNNLNRVTIQALPGLTGGFAEFNALMPISQKSIETAAEKLAELVSIDYDTAFGVLNQALKGNVKPLNDLGFAAADLAEGIEAIDESFRVLERNKTPLERFGRFVSNAWSDSMQSMIDDTNKLLGDDGIVGIFEGLGNTLLGLGLGTKLRNAITDAINSVVAFFSGGGQDTNDIDGQGAETESGFGKLGRIFGSQIVGGLFRWLLGDTAVALITAAWNGNWDLVFATLKDEAPEWGEQLGTAVRDGYIAFVLGPLFGPLLIDALNSEGGIKGALERLGPKARDWGHDLGVMIGNGLISAIEAAINLAVGNINDWISSVESILNQIPGVNFNFGRVGGIEIPRLAPRVPPEDIAPPILPPGLQSLNGMQAPLILQVNGREFARATISVMDGQMRVTQPGLGIS